MRKKIRNLIRKMVKMVEKTLSTMVIGKTKK